MKKTILLSTIAATAMLTAAKADHIWINEFHYDNLGGDLNEFIEVAFRSGSPTSIGDYSITLYNGAGGAPYIPTGGTSSTINLSTATASVAFPILNSTETITLYTLLVPGFQNGAPDGLALTLDTAPVGSAIQFLSYEGTFTAVGGPASGLMSTDVGVSEDGATADTSIGFAGMGDRASAFGPYQLLTPQTAGTSNTGQIFDAVPEPASVGLLALGGLSVLARRRRAA